MGNKIDNEIKTKNIESKYKEDKYFSKHNDNKLLDKYMHDIRNFKVFSINTIKNINDLSYEDRIQILITYNDMMMYYNSFFNDK